MLKLFLGYRVVSCTEVSVPYLFPTIFATNDGRTPTLGPKSCKYPSYLSSTVKSGVKRVEVVSQNGSSWREAKRQSSLGPTHHPPFSFGK